jgi:hypothetical protein
LNIVTEYPGWLVLLCILVAIVYAAILYFRNRDEDFPTLVKRVLPVFRGLAIFLIAFLLLNPLLKSVFNSSEKPIIILAQDGSQSLLIGKDSGFYKNDYPAQFNKLADELGSDYEVRSYTFSDDVSQGLDFSFSGKQTDVSALFDELLTRYSNRNVGALLLASDGLYNKGLNPVYASEDFKFPVYSLALGDTGVRKDIFIRKVNFNRIAYLGNSFPVEVNVGANLCKGSKTALTVSSKGNVLFSKNLDVNNNKFSETISLDLEAKEAGLQRYRISISTFEDEISAANNQEDIFIDVLDSKQKILILALSPHPDIAAIREAIESNFNYEVSYSLSGDFQGQIEEYNLIILHQLPGGNETAVNIIDGATKNKIPLFYILGSQSNLVMFNQQNAGLQIVTDNLNTNEALPVYNEDFSLFTVGTEAQKAFGVFPPLVVPFGDYKVLNSANTLFYQQIGSLETSYPLLIFNQTLINKTGIIAGEGIWRWKLGSYLKNGNHIAFNQLITKMVQFLSVKVDKSFFQVKGNTNFLENQQVEFDAEVYNQSYELINDPDVEMTVTNSEETAFPFVFSKTANAYHLNAGVLPVDNYTFEAKVRVGDMLYTENGEFTVSPLNIEMVNTIADHNLLYQLAVKHDGQMINVDQMEDFPRLLKERQDIKTITYSEKRYLELVNVFWIFLIILAVLATEWFIRKFNGSY